MKVLLMGAGAVASVISKYLAEEKSVSQVICATRDLERAKEFIDLENEKIKLVEADAADIDAVSLMAKGVDLIINASLPRFNENLMEVALRVGSNYQDLASDLLDLRTPEQLKFHERFKKAKLVAAINTGIAPGITNLMAAEGAEKLDSVDSINIRLVEEQKASELIFTWSTETALDELTAPPLAYRNGEFILLKPFANSEEYDFSYSVGKKHIFSVYGDEVSTIPLYIKTKNVDFKSSGTDIDFSKALDKLGLFNKKAIEFNGGKIIPIEFFSKIAPKIPTPSKMRQLVKKGVIEDAFFVLVVEVIGEEQGKRINVKSSTIFPSLKEISKIFPGANYISYPTGISAVSFSKIIPQIKSFGVFPPEALSSDIRKKILIELESHGIAVNQQFLGV